MLPFAKALRLPRSSIVDGPRVPSADLRGHTRCTVGRGLYGCLPAAVSVGWGTPGYQLELDADEYANEESLPPGKVLVVGSGQTGCQIAEELHEAGREVVLSCGRAPWAPRRPGGRDVILWLIDAGFYDQSVADLRSPAARLVANVQATGS